MTSTSAQNKKTAAAEGPYVLLVDDDVLSSQELARAFNRRDLLVWQASNSREALQRSQEAVRIDVLLIDQVLGDEISGVELSGIIQTSHPLVSIVFISAKGEDAGIKREIRERGLKFTGFLPKPFSADQAFQRVKQERFKFQLRVLIEDANREEVDSITVLQSVLAEVDDRRVHQTSYYDEELRQVEYEIDDLYERIWSIVKEGKGNDSDVESSVLALRIQLRKLQEKEVGIWRARSQSVLDLTKGERIVEEARFLLERYE